VYITDLLFVADNPLLISAKEIYYFEQKKEVETFQPLLELF
jgi:hypothetical protein